MADRAETAADLLQFRAHIRAASAFEVETTSIDNRCDWQYVHGALSHFSRGFFHVCGLRSTRTGEEHLVLFQPQSALTGLAVQRRGRDIYALVQARIEPGNVDVVQFGPTVQSTAANYYRMHGGRATSCLEWFFSFHPHITPLGKNVQLDIGRRYYLKSKVHSYIETNEQLQADDPTMIWAHLGVLFDTALLDNVLNTDLRSLLSVFDWDRFIRASPQDDNAPVQTDVPLLANDLGHTDHELLPLDRLTEWRSGPFGVQPTGAKIIGAGIFSVRCNFREKEAWTQPLVTGTHRGTIVLISRQQPDGLSYLLSVGTEPGIAGGYVILPSLIRYQEDPALDLYSLGHVAAWVIQSEEGGRFFQQENEYVIIRAATAIAPAAHQFWVTQATLKQLLKTSEKVSIQLRCICSLLLRELNPSI